MHPVVFIAVTTRTVDSVAASNPAQMDLGHITVSTVDILPALFWVVI
jgi:hypothetical protein